MLGIIGTDAAHEIAVEPDYKGWMFTVFPEAVMKLFFEAFKIVRAKRIKDLMLKMLHVYSLITGQIQDCMEKFLREKLSEFSMEYLIA